jgi:hypothetical protein
MIGSIVFVNMTKGESTTLSQDSVLVMPTRKKEEKRIKNTISTTVNVHWISNVCTRVCRLYVLNPIVRELTKKIKKLMMYRFLLISNYNERVAVRRILCVDWIGFTSLSFCDDRKVSFGCCLKLRKDKWQRILFVD